MASGGARMETQPTAVSKTQSLQLEAPGPSQDKAELETPKARSPTELAIEVKEPKEAARPTDPANLTQPTPSTEPDVQGLQGTAKPTEPAADRPSGTLMTATMPGSVYEADTAVSLMKGATVSSLGDEPSKTAVPQMLDTGKEMSEPGQEKDKEEAEAEAQTAQHTLASMREGTGTAMENGEADFDGGDDLMVSISQNSLTSSVLRPESLLDETMVKETLENYTEMPKYVVMPLLTIVLMITAVAFIVCFPCVFFSYEFPITDDGCDTVVVGLPLSKIFAASPMWWLNEKKFFKELFSKSVYYKLFADSGRHHKNWSMEDVYSNEDAKIVLDSLDAQRFVISGCALFALPILLYLIYLRCYSTEYDRLDEAILVAVQLALFVVFAAVEARYAMFWEASNLWNIFCDEFVEKFVWHMRAVDELTEVNVYLACTKAHFFAFGCALCGIAFASLALLCVIDLVLLLKHVHRMEDHNCLEMTMWLQKPDNENNSQQLLTMTYGEGNQASGSKEKGMSSEEGGDNATPTQRLMEQGQEEITADATAFSDLHDSIH